MQISDYISVVALIISATAIYLCWNNNRKHSKLSNAQKKTEILQEIDTRILKYVNIENIYKDILFVYNNDKEFYDFLKKHSSKDTFGEGASEFKSDINTSRNYTTWK